MAEVVLDENGNELDNEGKQKKALNADYMNKADVMAIVNGFTKPFDDAVAALNKVAEGAGFSEAVDAISRLTTVISGGAHIEFAKKNSWITDAAQRNKYLTMGGDQGIADKQLVIDLYKLITSTNDLRPAVVKMLGNCLEGSLQAAFSAIRFEVQMTEIATPNEVARIDLAFSEFEHLFAKCNDASIYNSLELSKTKYSLQENTEMALDYLDGQIMSCKYLSHFLQGAGKPGSAGMNELYIFDRETRAFADFASRADKFTRIINQCAELDPLLAAGYAVAADGLTPYLDCYRRLFETVAIVFQKALDVIEAFKTQKYKAPYNLMHYDTYLKEAAQTQYLGTLSDPFTQGTNYREMAMSMISRFQNLAKSIAKNAPA